MFKSLRFHLSILLISCIYMVNAQDTLTVTLGSNELKDAYINIVNEEPDGLNESLIASVWTYFGEYGIGRSLFGFDLTNLRNEVVIDARLYLSHSPNSSHIGHSTIGGDNTGMIFRIIEPWKEDSVTWANQPKTTNTNAIVIPAPDSSNSNFENIDITPIIKDMIRHPEKSDGFMIKLKSEDTLYRSLVFASSDHLNENLHPMIVITYVSELPVESTTKLQPDGENGNDACVFSSDFLNNKNIDHSLVSLVWSDNDELVLGRSYINFDLSQINSEHTITYAELSLFHDPDSEIEGHVNNGESNELILCRVVEDWSENTINWDNQPGVSEMNQVLVTSSNISNQDYLDIDVTKLVVDMISEPETSFGFSIKLADELRQDYNRNVVFASSNHANENLHPKLVVYSLNSAGIVIPGEKREKLSVYPNPGNGIFNVRFPIDDQEGELYVSDNSGKLIMVVDIENVHEIIDISDLPNGVYHFTYKGETGILHNKMVKL